jgi:ankyrin repeat protein
MQFPFFSLCLLVVFGLSHQICSASDDNGIFEGVQKDDTTAIKSAIKNDPSSLESIGPGGQTPLIHAVLTGKLESVKTLLDLGANTAATETDGYNVLHAAGFQGRSEILEVLLQHFANQKEAGGFVLDPSTDKHEDGFYPIHRSCWGREPRHTDTVKVFLTNNVSSQISADNGKTCAEMTNNEGTKMLILETVILELQESMETMDSEDEL